MAAVYERGGVWLPVPKPAPLRQVIRSALLNALAYTDGNQHEAARWLGMTDRQLCYALKTYGIPGARPRAATPSAAAAPPPRPDRSPGVRPAPRRVTYTAAARHPARRRTLAFPKAPAGRRR